MVERTEREKHAERIVSAVISGTVVSFLTFANMAVVFRPYIVDESTRGFALILVLAGGLVTAEWLYKKIMAYMDRHDGTLINLSRFFPRNRDGGNPPMAAA